MVRLGSTVLVLLFVAILAASCSDDNPATPGGSESQFLAGGGRKTSDDPFSGGPDGSGPGRPGFDPPDSGCLALFYAGVDCGQTPARLVITNQADWQTWWTAAIACLTGGDGGFGQAGRDSGVVEPDTLVNPYPEEAPAVDFAANVVLTISVEPDSLPGRSVWIQDVVDDPAGATVHYVVSSLGADCMGLIMSPLPAGISSPAIAVMVARPLTEPVTWQREDVTYDCTWEPDPSEPLTIYYTDAACDLGPAEALITDAGAFSTWLETALACDQARWWDPDGQTVPGDSSVTGPPVLPPDWLGQQVDFTTHAVIVLRGEAQTRWGGGVWLTAIAPAPEGTAIDYTVLIPGENCPEVGGGVVVQPTVAIRVPLPLTAPVTWHRTVETIACDWDSALVGGRW